MEGVFPLDGRNLSIGWKERFHWAEEILPFE